jgi:hypothetical protein
MTGTRNKPTDSLTNIIIPEQSSPCFAFVLETSVDYLVGEKPDPDEKLPPEARRYLEEFRSFLRHKYRSKE